MDDKNRQVLSLDDQEKVCRALAVDKSFTVLAIYRESKSAKRPDKRPVFAEMVERIHRHEATHIVCWKADRLCRNAKEGGMLIDKVDYEGVHVITSSMDYDRNTSTFLFIEFGMATKFSKDLSDNVKRGLNTKLQMGWLPGEAPIGYVNDMTKLKGQKDILPDLVRFALCRSWWEMMLTGKETVTSTLSKVTALGLRSKRTGRPVSKAEAFRFFRNIFYTGLFDYNGERFEGKHRPMITMAEYGRVQNLLNGRKKTYTKQQAYYFMKLLTCGECGAAITCEKHRKQYKNGTSQTFIYARCTKKSGQCNQPYINAKELEKQLLAFVTCLEIRPAFVTWLRDVLKRKHQSELTNEKIQRGTRTKRLDVVLMEKKKLYGMKDDGLISEEDYQKEKKKLLVEEKQIKETSALDTTESWKNAIEDVLAFAANLTKIFHLNDPEIKRTVLRVLGSNLILKDKIVCIDAKNVFIFLKQVETTVYKEKQWLEPKNSLTEQTNLASFPLNSGNELGSILGSNLKEYITPDLILQITMLQEHVKRENIASC